MNLFFGFEELIAQMHFLLVYIYILFSLDCYKHSNRVIYTHKIIRGRKFFSLLSHVSRVVTLANVLHSIKPFKAAPLRSSQLQRPTTQPKSQHVLFNTHSYIL